MTQNQNRYSNYSHCDIQALATKRALFSMSSTPAGIVRLSVTDTAMQLQASVAQNANGDYASAVLMTIEDNAVRVAFITTPINDAAPVEYYLDPGQSYLFEGPDAVASALIINATSGSIAIVQLTGDVNITGPSTNSATSLNVSVSGKGNFFIKANGNSDVELGSSNNVPVNFYANNAVAWTLGTDKSLTGAATANLKIPSQKATSGTR